MGQDPIRKEVTHFVGITGEFNEGLFIKIGAGRRATMKMVKHFWAHSSGELLLLLGLRAKVGMDYQDLKRAVAELVAVGENCWQDRWLLEVFRQN